MVTLLAAPPPPHRQPPADPAPEPAGARSQRLGERRAALAEELACVRRWQRLVQARLDLTTDVLSPADALAALGGSAAAGEERHLDPSGLEELVRGRTGSTAYDVVEDLRAVVAARRLLAARATEVARDLAATDADLAALAPRSRECCPRA